MSTDQTIVPNSIEASPPPLELKKITEILIKHYGLHEGKFDILIEFQIAVGVMGPEPKSALPGALLGVAKLGVARSVADGPTTVDAALVNPKPKKSR